MQEKIKQVLTQINSVVLGKEKQVRDGVACLLAGGHLLIEDIPGVGKTTLAHVLSVAFGLEFSRVQFTSDLMPGDLLGQSIFDAKEQAFVFKPGPVFSNVLLADEINRASPKTQSALLEAMEEHQVTVEGQSLPLPSPFFVIATQNPGDQVGTFPLPESQLDRFLMCISLGYPAKLYELELLGGNGRRRQLEKVSAVFGPGDLGRAQEQVLQVHASEHLLAHVYAIIHETRDARIFAHGLSPRAGIALVRAAKAVAYIEGRDHVSPDDVHAILNEVAVHRLTMTKSAAASPAQALRQVIQKIAL